MAAADLQAAAAVDHPFVEQGLKPLRELVESYAYSPTLSSGRQRFLEMIGNLERRAEELKTPLLILLVGGTGAGKSTLLNALAGGEIAATSAVRPCTSELTAYLHADDAGSLERFELGHAHTAHHERTELLQKIIVDAPDFDSVATANLELLRRTLPQADLILCLATAEKYLNRSLLDLLAEFRSGKRFLFVLNRADRGTPASVRDDWAVELGRAGFTSPEILWISAKKAFETRQVVGARASVSEAGGDFSRLETIITHELTRRRIRAIKQHNLDEGFRDLLESLAACMGPELENGLESWSQAAELEWRAFRDEVQRRFSLDLETDHALRYKLEFRLAGRYTSLFGFFLLLGNSLRALLSPLRPRPWSQESMEFSIGHKELSLAYDEAGFRARLDLLLRKTAELGRERGLNKEACLLQLDEPLAVDTFQTLKGTVDERLSKELLQLVESRGDRTLRFWNLVYNGFPLSVLVVALGRWVYKVLLTDQDVKNGYFTAVSIVVVGCLLVARFFAEQRDRKTVHRFLSGVRDLVRAAVDSALGDVLRVQLNERLATARAGLARLLDLKARRHELLSEVVSEDITALGLSASMENTPA